MWVTNPSYPKPNPNPLFNGGWNDVPCQIDLQCLCRSVTIAPISTPSRSPTESPTSILLSHQLLRQQHLLMRHPPPSPPKRQLLRRQRGAHCTVSSVTIRRAHVKRYGVQTADTHTNASVMILLRLQTTQTGRVHLQPHMSR